MEGLEIALHRTDLALDVELGCTEAIKMISATSKDRSALFSIIKEIQHLVSMFGREVNFMYASQTQNCVSHALAAYGRSCPRTAIWLGFGPVFAVKLAMAERPP